ncbi:putative membrane protein [Phytophthora megakarya]|uniref:Putative membrane protein n=1 Tax=Phytophthora megakarya TaxID=4795 RepID=A0A225WCW0_9STRA|nr:putative membrane protein [Phytophthora megakarya]
MSRWKALAVLVAIFTVTISLVTAKISYSTKSSILPWVDVDTPANAQFHKSSRGQNWTLIMSDEFNKKGRTFEAGEDHLWTAVDKPDGVNAALEIYAINMTSTECDDDNNCYFYIESDIDEKNITVWNDYITPPGYENVSFYYRAAMVQGWNKFCYQGGLAVVRAQLPGSGMNPYQGRGAPEIDILEGGGTEISSSMQIGPGMPDEFRQLHDKEAYYKKLRGYKSWYQGMRYGANNLCASDNDELQTFSAINASLTKGITENACSIDICPASFDVNADLGFMDNGTEHWGVNTNGTCFPRMNAYTGAYLCDAGNTAPKCTESGGSTSAASSFMYQMDALSSNWGIQLAAYLDWVTYTVEWIPGNEGYVRWEVEGHPLYEIPASTVTNPPQDAAQMNPKKIMIEEPMYFIFNVALSSSWGSRPPNAGFSGCYGDRKDKKTNAICDAFPMKMKIDYIRVYQDTSTMAYGCDPESHPTKQWIEDHIDSYQDFDNLVVEVAGKAPCNSDDDCTIASKGASPVRTGYCTNGRCECASHTWTGPRCTETTSVKANDKQYGPPLQLSIAVAVVVVLATLGTISYTKASEKKYYEQRLKTHAIQMERAKQAGSTTSSNEVAPEKTGYSTNFV